MRTIMIVALALAVFGTAADAASRHKHKRIHAARVAPAWVAPQVMVRPAWASPSPYECFTDDGYGRFLQCGAGRSN